MILKTWETTSPNPRPSHEAQDGDTVPYDEPFPNGQMYPGDPTRGAAEAANCTCVMTLSGQPEATPTFESVKDAEDYLADKYTMGDLSGLTSEDLPTLQDVIEQVDRLVKEFPLLSADPDWKFVGIGTFETVGVPKVVLELGQDAWGVTRNTLMIGRGPAIWLNTKGFREGTGLMGEIGFTAERTAIDAIVHEMGHAVKAVSDPVRVERIFMAARDEIYASLKSPMRGFMNDTGSIYAGGSSIDEAFATVFYRLNAPGGLDGLSKTAVRRLRKLADRVNEGVGVAVL